MAERLTKSLYILQQTKRKRKPSCIRKHGELAQGMVIFDGYNRIPTTNLHFEFNNINIKHSFVSSAMYTMWLCCQFCLRTGLDWDTSTSSSDLSLTKSSMQLTINSKTNHVLPLFITAWFSQELEVSTKMNNFTSEQYKLEMPFTGPKISCFPGSHP